MSVVLSSESEAETFATNWIEAWNRSDIEEVLGHFHPDAEFSSPIANEIVGKPTLVGHAEIRAYWQSALARVGSLHFSVESVLWKPSRKELAIFYEAQFAGKVRRACERMIFGDDGKVIRAEALYGVISSIE